MTENLKNREAQAVSARLDHFTPVSHVGTVRVVVIADGTVHVFALASTPYNLRLTQGRVGTGVYSFEVSLTTIGANGEISCFVADDDLGVVNPSHILKYKYSYEQLPPPTIISATSLVGNAKIMGTAMPGSRVKLVLAGQTTEVTASYDAAGTWRADFSGVPSGKQTVFARTTDPFGTYPDSEDASIEVKPERPIVRPLVVTTPPPDWEVGKKVSIRGVATPDRGPVLIQLGGGAVVESPVSAANNWGEDIFSSTHGPKVPLKVWLPTTGEEVSYTLNVKPFDELVLTTCVRTRDRGLDFPFDAFHIEGVLNYENEVYYYGVGSDGLLATRKPDDSWSYFGFPKDPEMRVSTLPIEGKLWPCVELSLLSDGRRVVCPLMGAAPTLTSPLVIGTSAELYGLLGGETNVVSVFVPGQGRRIAQGGPPDDEGREWCLKLDDLPPGVLQIELSASPDASQDYRFERASYTLTVEPTAELAVTFCLRTRDRSVEPRRDAFHIEGTLKYEDEVHYRGVGADGVLATRESDNSWSYFGLPEDPQLLVQTKVIDGQEYPCVELFMPSEGQGDDYKVIGAAPTLTSPLVIRTSAELYGLIGGETDVVSIFVPGRERQIVQGGLPDGEGREWVLKLDDLPPGNLQIELSASPNESQDYRFERASYTLTVKPPAELAVKSCLRTRDRLTDPRGEVFHIEGTLKYEDEVRYRGPEETDGLLATRKPDDSWSYFGLPENPQLLVQRKVIEGKDYDCVELFVPSEGQGDDYKVIGAAPTLTSPLVIGTSAELYGLVGGETTKVSVFVPGRERQVVQGGLPDDEGREWLLKLDDLPPGNLQIELSASPDESADHRFERVTYRLEVVALQPPTYLRATQQVSVTYASQAAEHTVQVVWEGVKTRRTNFQTVVEGKPNLFVIDRLWVTENIGKTVRVNYSVKLNSSGEEFMVSEVLEVKF